MLPHETSVDAGVGMASESNTYSLQEKNLKLYSCKACNLEFAAIEAVLKTCPYCRSDDIIFYIDTLSVPVEHYIISSINFLCLDNRSHVDMHNFYQVVTTLDRYGFKRAASWITNHWKDYERGLRNGFVEIKS